MNRSASRIRVVMSLPMTIERTGARPRTKEIHAGRPSGTCMRISAIPNVRASIAGHRVILTQVQATPPFDLPLDLAITTGSGASESGVHCKLSQRADTLEISGSDSIIAVHVDPDHRLLLQRHWGEARAVRAPGRSGEGREESRGMVGRFSLTAVPGHARRRPIGSSSFRSPRGDTCGAGSSTVHRARSSRAAIQAPMAIRALTFVRYVRPVQLLSDAYPKSLQPIL